MRKWILTNKIESIVFCLIILVSLFVRLYRISDYMQFLGDQGRDALVMKTILVDHHLPLLGPVTSVGNMYLGPLYYYMMAVSMAIFWLNPVAAAVMVALIGTATVALIYYLAREWSGKEAAVLSSLTYSLSPININYSNFSWNPNPAPFFALLTILGIYFSRKFGNYRFLWLTGGALAFAVQMHYLALILIPILGVLWLYELWGEKKLGVKKRNFWNGTIWAGVIFLVLMSPLFFFDIRHNFMNFKALGSFFIGNRSSTSSNIFLSLGKIPDIYTNLLIGRYMAGENFFLSGVLALFLIVVLLKFDWDWLKNKKLNWPILILGVWLLIGLLGLSFYKGEIYDHYLGFLNPCPFLLLGAGVYLFRKSFRVPLTIFLTALLVTIYLVYSPLRNPPNRELFRTQQVAKKIIEETGGEPFNFALIAKSNYDSAYQFYLYIYGHPASKVPFNVESQLFVVCEDPVCQPTVNPKYEVAAFGMSRIISEEEIYGVKLYHLTHLN